MQYMLAKMSSAWLPGSRILQVAEWLFQSYFTSAETTLKSLRKKLFVSFFLHKIMQH